MADIPGDGSTGVTLTLGIPVNGVIDLDGDHDWYRIELVAGQKYTFTLTGNGPTPLSDPYLRLRDAGGTELAFDDDSGAGLNSKIIFTAGYTGTYYLDASAFSSEIGGFEVKAVIYTPPPIPPIYNLDQIADQLETAYWGAGNEHRFNVTQGGQITVDVTALTDLGRYYAREALGMWADITGIAFAEVQGGAQISFDDAGDGASTGAQWSGGFTSAAQIDISTAWLTSYGSSLNSYNLQTYVHEIGHALGLGHAGDYNTTADYENDAVFRNDAWTTTIMSYFSQNENTYFQGLGYSYGFVLTPMVGDIAAIEQMYGLSTTTRAGNTVYGFGSTAGRAVYDAAQQPGVFYTIFDSGGIDTLNYSGHSQNQRIDLNPEAYSNIGGRTGNVAIARGSIIENAIGGSGSDTLIGNAVDNRLSGGLGADLMDGGAGYDLLDYSGNFGAVWIDFATGRGQWNYAHLDSFTNMEGVIGTAYNDWLFGDAGNNYFIGGLGGDLIDGRDGVDTVDYTGNFGAIRVNLLTGIGEFNYAHGDQLTNIENLIGTDYNDQLTGNALVNRLDGGAGDDILSGGLGADVLIGGAGQDSADYRGNFGAVWVDLATGVGQWNYAHNDTLSGIEAVLGTEYGDWLYGGAAADRLEGNGGDDDLRGFGGNDILLGGAGNDRITGGLGLDQVGGGSGADQFLFDGLSFVGFTESLAEVILDFSFAEGDRIDLSAVDGNYGTVGDEALIFIGTAAFSSVAGQLRYQQSGTAVVVTGDVNGDGNPDFALLLQGIGQLGGSEFIL